MRPLEETFRASAAALATRSGSRQGGNEQVAGEAGAFENAVADAGRQKAPAQGAAEDIGQDVAETLADRLQAPAAGLTIGNRRAGVLIAGATITGAGHLSTPSVQGRGEGDAEGALPEDEMVSKLNDLRENAATKTSLKDDESGDSDGNKVAARPKGHAPAEAGTTGAVEVATTAEGETGSAAPANGPVSDLLTLLGGNVPTVTDTRIADKATRSADDRAAGQADESANISVDAAAGDGSRTEQQGEVGSDRLFRFARADGKGQAVSMTISADGETAAVETGRSSASAKAESVTVLEARRYLGVAMNANSAAVTGAIAGDGEWAQALQSSAAFTQPEASGQAGKTLNTLKIQMHPIDLGTVTATLRLKDDELQVDLKVETGEAFRQLRDDQSEMVKALRAQGFAVDQVNVVFNAGGDASSGSGSQAQTQGQLGQPGRERTGEDGGQGRQRQDGAQVATVETWVGNDGTDDASSGVERARAGHVYM
ncbi:flagellar hook-length control protein FliK [Ensifer sp. BR816]|uniref:flagellar hook-length control protein FliK n=1 Tax=Rhizobium sp. (strain BR816) TaxID=1057002 RepID=UPI000367AA94|nr:flagellar hook-length control protein FliK [Ensifer sp. BR816]